MPRPKSRKKKVDKKSVVEVSSAGNRDLFTAEGASQTTATKCPPHTACDLLENEADKFSNNILVRKSQASSHGSYGRDLGTEYENMQAVQKDNDLVDASEDSHDSSKAPSDDENVAIILDAKNSERQYYRDPITRIEREIWRPGDGDGVRTTEYYDRSGAPLPIEQRWRFYQLRTGAGNLPPKYVFLDDRAVFEVLNSDVPRKNITDWWPHDFGGVGKVRHRRPHRGRCAIGDPDATGIHMFHFAEVGMKKQRYYFTGETDYTPIIYRGLEDKLELASTATQPHKKRKASSPAPGERPSKGNQVHKRLSSKEELTAAKGGGKQYEYDRNQRINKFLRRDPSPELIGLNKAKLYGAEPQHLVPRPVWTDPTLPTIAGSGKDIEAGLAGTELSDEEGSMWVMPDDPIEKRKHARKMQLAAMRVADDNSTPKGSSSSDMGLPFHGIPDSTDKLWRKAVPASHSMHRVSSSVEGGLHTLQLETDFAQAKRTIEEQGARIEDLEMQIEESKKDINKLQATVAKLVTRVGLQSE